MYNTTLRRYILHRQQQQHDDVRNVHYNTIATTTISNNILNNNENNNDHSIQLSEVEENYHYDTTTTTNTATTGNTNTTTNRTTNTTTTTTTSTTSIIKCIFFLLGIGVLVPWNLFISLKEYYQSRFCDTNNNNQHYDYNYSTTTTTNIESIFATVYNLSSVITMVLLISIQMLYDQYYNNNNHNHNTKPFISNITTSILGSGGGNGSGCSIGVPPVSSFSSIVGVEMSDQQQQQNIYPNSTSFDDSNNNSHHHHTTTTTTINANEYDPLCHTKNSYISSTRKSTDLSTDCKLPVVTLPPTSILYKLPKTTTSPTTTSSSPTVMKSSIPSSSTNTTNTTKSIDHSFYLVIVPFLIFIIVFSIQCIFVLNVTIKIHYIYNITILCIIFSGIASGLIGAGIIAVIAKHTYFSIQPNIAMNPYQIGISMAGVTVSMINFIIAYMKNSTIDNNYYNTYCRSHHNHQDDINVFSAIASMDDSDTTSDYRSMSGYDIVSRIDSYQSTSNTNTSSSSSSSSSLSSTCQPYDTIDYAIFWYFIIAITILILCLFGFLYIQHLSSHCEYMSLVIDDNECTNNNNENITSKTTTTTTPSSSLNLQTSTPYYDTPIISKSSPTTTISPTSTLILSNNTIIDSSMNDQQPAIFYQHNNDNNNAMMVGRQITDEGLRLYDSDNNDVAPNTALLNNDTLSSSSSSSFQNVFDLVYGPTICIFMTFCLTLSIFPSWTSELRSIYQCNTNHQYHTIITRYSNDLYVPFTFVIFNFGDLLGRIISSTSWRWNMNLSSDISTKLICYSLLRFVLCMLLLTCPATDRNRAIFGFTIQSDLYSILVQLVFAITNGYLISISFAFAPKRILLVQNKQQTSTTTMVQERMSEILSLAVNFGLFSGSTLSLLVSKWTSK